MFITAAVVGDKLEQRRVKRLRGDPLGGDALCGRVLLKAIPAAVYQPTLSHSTFELDQE